MNDSRQRGSVSLLIVVALSLVAGSILLGSGSDVAPLRRETRRLHYADAALALAEAGVEVARSELARGGGFKGLKSVPLGRGHVSVVQVIPKRTEVPGEVVLLSSGRVAGPPRLGPGGTITRRIRVVLRLRAKGQPPTVVDWKEE